MIVKAILNGTILAFRSNNYQLAKFIIDFSVDINNQMNLFQCCEGKLIIPGTDLTHKIDFYSQYSTRKYVDDIRLTNNQSELVKNLGWGKSKYLYSLIGNSYAKNFKYNDFLRVKEYLEANDVVELELTFID